jgi:hypothetical protein
METEFVECDEGKPVFEKSVMQSQIWYNDEEHTIFLSMRAHG